MAELRPETWLLAPDPDTSSNGLASLFQKKKQPVTDIAVWVQCYSSMVSVLVEKYPQFIKHFLAYQAIIVMGYKRAKGLSWVAYDAAFRRKAAAAKSLLWGTVDQYLYTVWFTNQAQNPACTLCFGADHTFDQCPSNMAIPLLGHFPRPIMAGGQHAGANEWGPGAHTDWPPAHIAKPQNQRGEVCGLFNAVGGPRCPYNPCRFRHVCKSCQGAHPASQCPRLSRKRPPAGIKTKASNGHSRPHNTEQDPA